MSLISGLIGTSNVSPEQSTSGSYIYNPATGGYYDQDTTQMGGIPDVYFPDPVQLTPVFQADYHEQMGDWPVLDDSGGISSDPGLFDFSADAVDGGDGGGGGGDGGGGGGTPAGIGWEEFDSGLAGPDWWKAMKPSEMTKGTEQLANLNLLIPLLSPEDQRQVAQAIYNADPKNFAHLNPEDKDFFPPPGVGRGIREQFQDSSRAESGLAALTKLAEATGTDAESQGAGTRFLRNILDQMRDFSGGGQQSRQQFADMMGSIDPTIQGATSEQKPFQSLGRMLSQPFFSSGSLQNVRKNQEGQYVFGQANKNLMF